MTTYEFADPSGVHRMTGEEIIKWYFPHWAKRMREAGKHDEISHARCIEDFCVINWAYKVKDI